MILCCINFGIKKEEKQSLGRPGPALGFPGG